MSQKKKKGSKHIPEKSISERIRFHKGQTKTLRKRLDYLEKRVADLELKMSKVYTKTKREVIEPVEEVIDPRKEFIKHFHPDYKDKEE